jgi:sulfopyruvate decarboxylase TPP-binding subunit
MKQYAVIVHEALKESGINFVAYLPDDQIHDAPHRPTFTSIQ